MTTEPQPPESARWADPADVARLVGRVSRSVTHRLVNDLAGLRLGAEAAARSDDPGVTAARIASVGEGAAQAVALVRELHRLGDANLVPRPVDLHALAVELAPLLTAIGVTRGDVVLDPSEPATVVEVDPVDVRRQIVAALLDHLDAADRSGSSPLSLTVDPAGPGLVLRDGDDVVVSWSAGD